jgi:Ca2+/Na+ antiporter
MSRILSPHVFQIFPLSELKQLEQNFDFIILSAILLHLVYVFGGLLSNKFSSHYRNLQKSKQASWRIHIVSVVFSLLVIPLSIPMYSIKSLQNDKLFGSSTYSASLISFAIGYFLWDLIISIIHFSETGWPFVFHALACMSVFGFSLYPYAQGYASVFLLFEVSTVFLNVHW